MDNEGGVMPGKPLTFEERELTTPLRPWEYWESKSRCNPIIVRSHLQDAMQAGASGAVLTAIVAAIKEIER
jgi:hypothetical protein